MTTSSTTIHNFSTNTHPDATVPRAVKDLLESCQNTTWKTIDDPHAEVEHLESTNVYEYHFAPPIWSFSDEIWLAGTVHRLKQWSDPIEDHEIFSLSDLADFTLLATDKDYIPGAPYAMTRTVSIILDTPNTSVSMDVDQSSEDVPGLAGSLQPPPQFGATGQRFLRDRSISMSFDTDPGVPYYPLHERSDIAPDPPSFIHHLAQSSQPNSVAELKYTKERDEFGFSISSARYRSFDRMDPYAEGYELPRNNYLHAGRRERDPYSISPFEQSQSQFGETPESLHLKDVSLLYAQRDPSVPPEPFVLSPPSPKSQEHLSYTTLGGLLGNERHIEPLDYATKADGSSSDDSLLYGNQAPSPGLSRAEIDSRGTSGSKMNKTGPSTDTSDFDMYGVQGSSKQGQTSFLNAEGGSIAPQHASEDESPPPGLGLSQPPVVTETKSRHHDDVSVPWPSGDATPDVPSHLKHATGIQYTEQIGRNQQLDNAPEYESFKPSGSAGSIQPNQLPADLLSSIDELARTLKLGHDFGHASIADLIPKPHYYSTPFFDHNSLAPLRFKPYTARQPIPLLTSSKATVFPLPPWSRAAWIVPIRGQTPWSAAGASSGTISMLPAVPAKNSNTMVWTATSLSRFWELLVSLYQSMECGPIGIMFHTVERFDESRPSPKLAEIDYIKIYCDGEYIMYARQAISQDNNIPTIDGHLVLVDEVGDGILLL